ncbi:histone-like nucleoid-structuring protein Lsr2 [Actinophytocola glycyrrhizae]|uniref:Lsr2 family protein n=1 Tax=Actinophytocola glycyrrhizae TaxID=2044873 RepID=A0ABV9RU70_9PSEU
MAQKVLVRLVDDLDGTSSEDVSTVSFGLDGVEYEIDLSERNAENLRKEVAEYVAAARRTGGRRRRGTSPNGESANRGEAGVIREWALENGYELSARGRMPSHVVEAYNAARTAEAQPAKRKTSRKK